MGQCAGGYDAGGDDGTSLAVAVTGQALAAAPLIWLDAWKEEIAARRGDNEDACLRRPAEAMPAGCRVSDATGESGPAADCSRNPE